MIQDLHTWQPLPRAEVIKAVERKHPARVPLIHACWWGEGLVQQYGDRLREWSVTRKMPRSS